MRIGRSLIVTALIIFLVTLVQIESVRAHAVIIQSSLQEQPVKAYTESKLLLSFNSSIELALSRFFLVSKGDQQQPVNVKPTGEQGRILIELPALEEGEYAINYKVFGADGHLTQNLVHFTVAAMPEIK